MAAQVERPLPSRITCPECREAVKALGFPDPCSRSAVDELHYQHRPNPPWRGQAPDRRRTAKAAWDAWEKLGPYYRSPGHTGAVA